MSQQHPFPSHLPRGVVSSALTLQKNPGGTTVLRAAGASPAIQIPAAPSVPSVSVSVPTHPALLSRNPVISAIRPSTPPVTRSPSPAINIAEHQRASLIVQGTSGPVGALAGPPLQITLTQRATPLSMNITDTMKMPMAGKTIQAAQPTLLQHSKVALPGHMVAPVSVGISMATLQSQAVLAAPKPGLQVTGTVPAISISSLSAPLQAVAPQSAAIPIAKVPPQRQQLPHTAGLCAPVSLQTITSGAEFSCMPADLSIASQTGASQLLLTQTQRSQAVTVVTATTGSSLVTAIPAVATSLAAQHAERPSITPMLQNPDMWLQRIYYQQPAGRPQLITASANQAPLLRPGTNTFFVPQPGSEQGKAQTQSLTATLSHPIAQAQPTVLFNAHMMVDGLRQPLNLHHAQAVSIAGTLSSTVSTMSGVHDNKPVITLSTNNTQPSLHASLIAASTASVTCQSSDPVVFPSSTSLHMAANLASGNTGASILSPNMGLSSRATAASSIIAAASAHQNQSTVQQQPPGTPSSSTSSPRPSILRKRNVDGNVVVPRKPNFNLTTESHSPRPDTAPLNISSPKTPATDNSQSSTDTALSSNDATTPTHNCTEVKIKHEIYDGTENGPTASPAVSQTGSITDASPRKRARKQLFDVSHRNVNEDVKDNTSSDDDVEPPKLPVRDVKLEHFLDNRDEYIDEDGVRWTKEKTKPTMSIMGEYIMNWKPKLNHFVRYNDVRPKDDRNPTVNELISQKGILQKATGWRIHYVSSQVEDVIENEELLAERMERIKERLHAKVVASSQTSYGHEYHKLLELAKGNLQRCQVVMQQMKEAKTSMIALLEHRPKVEEIIKKNLAKRTIKKKERT